ncbi:MAG: enoyl-CoA hydratase/isomerase family protein [Pseudomonadota bacterium]
MSGAQGGRATLIREGAVAWLTFSNPDAGLMDPAMEAQLLAAIEEVEADETLRVCVLTGGQPDVFIRHYDLKTLAERAEFMREKGYEFTADRPVPEGGVHTAMRRMEAGETIYLAALNGTAMGGGFELALACDIRLVQSGDHQFGLPEVNLGLLPGAGGTQRLPRLIGPGRALSMMLTGRTLSPTGMNQLGLASEVTDDVAALARGWADRLAAKPPLAVRHIKRLAQGEFEDGWGAERSLFCDLMVSDDAARLLAEGAAGDRIITDDPEAP